MIIVRHARPQDSAALFTLVSQVDVGMTSLPKDEAVLQARLQQTHATLEKSNARADQRYLFVLEDTDSGVLMGVSAIDVMVGTKDPFYEFRLSTQVHSSKTLQAYNRLETLILTNDYTGTSELCSLFVAPQYRKAYYGKLISKARLLFMAGFPECFADTVMAEMRGFFDDQGESPFWRHFSSKFFQASFADVDYLIGTANKSFIAEMMPRFPIYLDFVADEARAVIGKVHPNTASALALLQAEGLRFNQYIDIIDGGPKVDCALQELRAVRQSGRALVQIGDDSAPAKAGAGLSTLYLLSNERFNEFRAGVIELPDSKELPTSVVLSPAQACALRLQAGDKVRILPLNPPKY